MLFSATSKTPVSLDFPFIEYVCLLFREIATREDSVGYSALLRSDFEVICYSAEILHISFHIIELGDFRGGVTEKIGNLARSK